MESDKENVALENSEAVNKTEPAISKPKESEGLIIAVDERINLAEELGNELSDYLISYSDGVLDLCCHNTLDISDKLNLGMFSISEETYEQDGVIDTVQVLKYKNSYIKRYYNDHPRRNSLDLVCGRIVDSELIGLSIIKLGMAKSDFFEAYFQPSDIIQEISKLVIYENELGEAYTIYRFKNGKLIEIGFDSDYDWIDRNI